MSRTCHQRTKSENFSDYYCDICYVKDILLLLLLLLLLFCIIIIIIIIIIVVVVVVRYCRGVHGYVLK